MSFTPSTTVQQVLASPAARAVVQRWAPAVLESPYLTEMAGMPIRVVVEPPTLFVETGVTGAQDPHARERLWAELTALEATVEELRREVADLRSQLDAFRKQFE